MKKNIFKNKNGYSLIEVLFYTAIFSVVFFIVINSIITFMDSFKQISKNTELIQSSQILDTINREIKKAESATIAENVLTLNGKDVNGNDRIVYFRLENSNINLSEKIGTNNEVLIGPLNDSSHIRVDIFNIDALNYIGTSSVDPDAIYIEITFTSTRFGKEKSETFSTASVLRGKYAN